MNEPTEERPVRREVDDQSISVLARYAGIRIEPTELPLITAVFQEHLQALREWESERLGFDFRAHAMPAVKPRMAYPSPFASDERGTR